MAAEYRLKYADKAVMASGEDENLSRGAWAYVCAGGSLPNLPATTDVDLLAAIPHMRPSPQTGSVRVLREPGRQLLVYGAENKVASFDLSSESGSFAMGIVNQETGYVSWMRNNLQAGGTVALPAGVIWLKHL